MIRMSIHGEGDTPRAGGRLIQFQIFGPGRASVGARPEQELVRSAASGGYLEVVVQSRGPAPRFLPERPHLSEPSRLRTCPEGDGQSSEAAVRPRSAELHLVR